MQRMASRIYKWYDKRCRRWRFNVVCVQGFCKALYKALCNRMSLRNGG